MQTPILLFLLYGLLLYAVYPFFLSCERRAILASNELSRSDLQELEQAVEGGQGIVGKTEIPTLVNPFFRGVETGAIPFLELGESPKNSRNARVLLTSIRQALRDRDARAVEILVRNH